jgi:hypothetical protein
VTTYTGTGSARSITGLNFGTNPDLVWIKSRSFATNGRLLDTVRGATKELYSAESTEETTQAQSLTSFDRDGFSLGTLSNVNQDTSTFVAWAWKAGGNKNTFNVDDVGYATAAAAGLNGGTLTVTGASVGTKQGFSIIKYTGSGNAGDSASHGLLEAPKFIITKNIDNGTYSWRVLTTAIDGSLDRLFLNATSSAVDQSGAGVPTSSVFYVGSNLDHNKLNDNIIAYLWHDVPGLQKFGHYVANGNADGNYIELGFRPAILWIKATGSYSPGNWFCHDAERDKVNPTAGSLQHDSTNAEDTLGSAYYVDFLSDGFKLRADGNGENGASGYTYLYCAWAEAPSVDLFGGGANAR